MSDGRADLRFDVVADDGQSAVFETACCQYGCDAMKTGMQFTNAQPASRTCSTYHLVAISEPTGR